MSEPGVFYRPPPTVIDKLGQLNWALILALSFLAAVGLAAQYSVAGGSWSPWAERHALRFIMGLGVLIAISAVPLQVWMRVAYPVYGVALAALVLVPFIGTEALGARRWLPLGPLSFQPSELMKLALALALARYFQDVRPERLWHPLPLLPPVTLIAVPMALILKQPDLGTAVMLVFLGGGILLMAGVHILYFVGGAVSLGVAVPQVLPLLHDYQRRRIDSFLDPTGDPLGAGYHVMQSKIAMGSGGVVGKGFMAGTQSQLDFLPEKHTDFIFTTIAEEWGFVGSVAVIAMFAFLLVVLFSMSLAIASRAGRLLVCSSMLSIFTAAVVNIGMVSGLLPVVGIPLPFVSYGGTSMLTLQLGLGLAMCAWVHRSETLRPPAPIE